MKRSPVALIAWIIVYAGTWVVHLSWALWGRAIAQYVVGIQTPWVQYFTVFGAWLIIVVLSSGCPFTYLHQWIELRAGWRDKITYRYEGSLGYRYILRPAGQLIGVNSPIARE